MKTQEIAFWDSTTGLKAEQNRIKGISQKALDWDTVAKIIKEKYKEHPDLVVEAGLQTDWAYTGGVIFENGKPTNDNYTYLSSNWATPSIVLNYDGEDQEDIPCVIEANERFDSDSKWDEISLGILGISL